MEVMSCRHYIIICLVIIVFSLHVSLQTSIRQADGTTKKPAVVIIKPRSEPEVKSPATFSWQSGVVPFVIGPDYDEIITQRIHSAMRIIESFSCVVFKDMKKITTPGEFVAFTWLSIENPDGVRECTHTTMREEGVLTLTKAILVIGYDCMTNRDILHALLHGLGFRDEVTHPQRDMYIRVMWPNIQPKYRSLFWMRMGDTPHKTVEYDTMSIMHFHDRAFSTNGGPTVIPLIPGLLISPSDTLSQIDVMKLRLAYGHECNKRKVGNLMQTCQIAFKENDKEEINTEEPSEPVVPAGPTKPEDPENYANSVEDTNGDYKGDD